jgi:hypothetical protein
LTTGFYGAIFQNNDIEKMGLTADPEHAGDMRGIAGHGVTGSPALVINRKVRALGSVPSKSKPGDLILGAAEEPGKLKGV